MGEKPHPATFGHKAVSGAKADFRKKKIEFDNCKRAKSVYDAPRNIPDKLFENIYLRDRN